MGRAYQNRKDSMAKTSDAKARVYSKYGREIYVIAKSVATLLAIFVFEIGCAFLKKILCEIFRVIYCDFACV